MRFPDIEITIDGQKCCVELGERPCTVVKPNGTYTKDTFWTNCNNMYTLSINQQNHQLRWFQLVLEVIECMKVVQNKVPIQSADYLAFARTNTRDSKQGEGHPSPKPENHLEHRERHGRARVQLDG